MIEVDKQANLAIFYVLEAPDMSVLPYEGATSSHVVFKVGYTKNLNNRKKALQNGCPGKLGVAFCAVTHIDSIKSLESYIKNCHFVDNKTSGGTEWFHLESKLFYNFLVDLYKTFDGLGCVAKIPDEFQYLSSGNNN